MKTRRLFILNLWDTAVNLAVPSFPGWERIALVNCGTGTAPVRPAYPTSGAYVIDWENRVNMPAVGNRPGRTAFRREWGELFRGAAEGTIGYGVDPSVHWGATIPPPAHCYDDSIGNISYVLRVQARTHSLGLDYYVDRVPDAWSHGALCAYRRSRLREVQNLNRTDSVQFVSGQEQRGAEPDYGDGAKVLSHEWMQAQVRALDFGMSVCVFAAASTPAGYDAAVAGLIEMVEKIDLAEKAGGVA